MDGSALKKIIKNTGISTMTLDRKSQKLYWINILVGIEASDYNGENIESYPTDTSNIVDLEIADDLLFWLWLGDQEIQTSHHLLSCRILNGICEDHVMQELESFERINSIKIIHTDDQTPISNTVNACTINNGGCQDLCFILPSGKSSCICSLGWQLNPDQRTCREVKEYLLYSYENYFRTRILDVSKNSSIDVLWPTPDYVGSTGEMNVIFDYDANGDVLYFTDGHNIFTTKLKSNWTGLTVLRNGSKLGGSSGGLITVLAYDGMTSNLYFLEIAPSISIRVFNVQLGPDYEKSIVGEGCEAFHTFMSRGCTKIATFAIDPYHGFLFYVTTELFSSTKIYKTTMDGTKLSQMDARIRVFERSKIFTIDSADERLYWIQSSFPAKVSSINYNGTDLKNLTLPGLFGGRIISVHRRWIYMPEYNEILRFDKISGKSILKLRLYPEDDSSHLIGFLKVIGNSPKPDKRICDSACEQLCYYYNSKAVCGCRNGESLDENGHCRKDEPKFFYEPRAGWRLRDSLRPLNSSHLFSNRSNSYSHWHFR